MGTAEIAAGSETHKQEQLDPRKVIDVIAQACERNLGHYSHEVTEAIERGTYYQTMAHCEAYAGRHVARALNREFPGRSFQSVVSANWDMGEGQHIYLVEQNDDDPDLDIIIDPTAKQWLTHIPPSYRRYFLGSMFLGRRDQLRSLIMDPRTKLRIIDTNIDRAASFQQTWGSKSIPKPVFKLSRRGGTSHTPS